MTYLRSFKKCFYHKSFTAGFIGILFFVFTAFTAFYFAPFSAAEMSPQALKLPPQLTPPFYLGTDDMGRDLLSRLLLGTRISLSAALCVVFISSTLGILLGILSGYFEQLFDAPITLLMNILMCLPSILLAIVVVSVLGPGLTQAVWAVAFVSIPSITRIVRASVMAEKEKDYIQTSKALGQSRFFIIFKHLIPNIMGPLMVQMALTFSDAILNIAALGFLGLGATPPTPEWGTMLSDARPYIQSAPWMVILPGVCIMLLVLSFNLLGDGLRDILDPKLKN